MTNSQASWTINVSLGIYAISILLPFGVRELRVRWSRDGFLLIVFMVVLELVGHRQAEAIAGLGLSCGSIWMSIRSRGISSRLKTAWLSRWRSAGQITLNAPFRGKWKASGCGPNAAANHHLAAPDQWFAVDWVRLDGETFGSEILSPVDGVIAHVEDGHADEPPARWRRKPNIRSPAGNYVAIEVAGSSAYVLLCHLKRGSLRVEAGASVRAGDPVGLCGNSGNTSAPHLHIHAQDRAEIAVGRATGLPLRFRAQAAEEWLAPGSILES